MHTIIVKLDPSKLENADLDIRYVLPDLFLEQSAGAIEDDGYDYAENDTHPRSATPLLLFLKVHEVEPALDCICNVIENVRLLGNDFRQAAIVAVVEEDGDKVVYPHGYEGLFQR